MRNEDVGVLWQIFVTVMLLMTIAMLLQAEAGFAWPKWPPWW